MCIQLYGSVVQWRGAPYAEHGWGTIILLLDLSNIQIHYSNTVELSSKVVTGTE